MTGAGVDEVAEQTGTVTSDVGATGRRRLGRRQITGVLFAVLGVILIVAVAPSITSETKSFAFESPPDPLQFSFSPPTLIVAVGVLYLLSAVAAFGPQRFDGWAGRLHLFSAISAVPLIMAIALGLSGSSSTNVTNLLDESLVLATPVALGAMTGLWCERSGIINIGIEGMMLASAGVGFMSFALLGAASSVAWLWVAVLVAILTGGLLALLLAVLSINFGINQIVAGVVINLFALGLTGFLRSEVIVPNGNSKGLSTTEFGVPLLSRLPILGETLFQGKPIHYAMYAVVGLTWLVMFRTAWGLRVRSCGENPHAAETLGIDVITVRYQAVVVGGFIAGMAGAWFSLESQSGFEDNMTNSAGFIALAALIFGKWTPWGAFAGALLFGFARALGSRLQFLQVEIGGFGIPSEFFQSLPFVVTIVVVAGALGRSIAPAAEGQPFRRSK